jgi:hypothetical protein
MAHIVYVEGRNLKYQEASPEHCLEEARQASQELGGPEMWLYEALSEAPWHVPAQEPAK